MKKISKNILEEYPIIGQFIELSLKDKENPLNNFVEAEGFAFIQDTLDELNKELSTRTELGDHYSIHNFELSKVKDIQKDFFDKFQDINYDKTKPFYVFEGRQYGKIKDTSRDVLVSYFNATVAVYKVTQADNEESVYILIEKNQDGAFVVRTTLMQYSYRDEETSAHLHLYVFGSKGEDKGVNRYRILQFNKKTEDFSEPCIAYLTDDTTEEGYTFVNDIGEASIVSAYRSELYSSINNKESQYHILIDTYEGQQKQTMENRYLYTCTKGKCELFAGFTTPEGKTYVIFEMTLNTGYLNFKASLVDDLEDIPKFFYNYGHDVRYYSYKAKDIENGTLDISGNSINDKTLSNVVNKDDLKSVLEMLTAFKNFETFPDLLSSSERINNPGSKHIYHWDHLDTNTGVFGNIISERIKYE